MCDHCTRVFCLRHAPAIKAVPEDIRAGLEFVCPSCHKREAISRKDSYAPYYVSCSFRLLCHVILSTCLRSSSIQGLYHAINGQRKEFLGKWVELELSGARPQHAKCDNRPVIIINLRLESLVEEGTPAHIVHGVFAPYYPGVKRANLRYIDFPYTIHGQDDIKPYQVALNKAISDLFKYVEPIVAGLLYS